MCITAHYLLSAYSFEGVDEEHGFLEIVGDGGEEAAAPVDVDDQRRRTRRRRLSRGGGRAGGGVGGAHGVPDLPAAFVGSTLTVVRADVCRRGRGVGARREPGARRVAVEASTATHALSAVSDDAELNMAEAGMLLRVLATAFAELRAATRPGFERLRE